MVKADSRPRTSLDSGFSSEMSTHRLWVLFLVGFALFSIVVLPGCNTGSRTNGQEAGPPPPPDDIPQLFDVTPAQGKPGDVLTLSGRNFSATLTNNLVTFTNNAGTIELPGLVETVQVGLFEPGQGAPSTLTVRVPSGVRTGFVGLTVELFDGITIPAGGAGFTGAPVILGVAIDDDGQGVAIRRDAGGNVFPEFVHLVGYNLINNVTGVDFLDGVSTLVAPSITNGPPINASYTLAPGIEVIGVEIPSGMLPSVPSCDTQLLTLEATAAGGGGLPLAASPVRIPFAVITGLSGAISDIPANFTGATTPTGIRRGEIEISYNLVSDPSSARWNVIHEYQDPADPLGTSWQPCTPAPGSTDGEQVLPGTILQSSQNPGIVGPGQGYRFTWDSEADLPAGLTVTRVRTRTTTTAQVESLACAGSWITDWLVIDNSVSAAGSFVEDFNDNSGEDQVSTAFWNPNQSGTVLGADGPGGPAWGDGEIDIVFLSGGTYELDSQFGSITDTTKAANPIDMFFPPTLPPGVNPGNPGAGQGEFHVRSVVFEADASLTFFGNNPIVFRCSGDGTDEFTAARIAGQLRLDGQGGTEPPTDHTANGVGGAGGIGGGGAGGDGAFLTVDGSSQTVSGLVEATDGEGLGAGEAGSSSTLVTVGVGASLPKGGPAGSAGHAQRGENGIQAFNPLTSFLAPVGRGGVPHGDSAITRLRAGAGGGGGGAAPVRLNQSTFQARQGGGGGGGGGAIAVIAQGSIELIGLITANGGDGAKGSLGQQGGPGAGGAGGTILFRATGDIELGNDLVLSALGGFGAITASNPVMRGGDGSNGRIRLEANGQLLAPGVNDGTFDPPIGSPGITEGISPGEILVGSGVDGSMDSATLGSNGTFVVDTDTGTISDDTGLEVFANASGNGLFEFTRFDLPEGVTLRAVGSNPLIIQVAGVVDIAGVIDASGAAGGIPDATDPMAPLNGLGGVSGAGGGAGGNGGEVTSSSAGDGQPGGLSVVIPPQLIATTPPIGGGGNPGGPTPDQLIEAAAPGIGLFGDNACDAGAGGGGGYALEGSDGLFSGSCPEAGDGGSRYGSTFFLVPDPLNPAEPILLLAGGGGGSGGGGFSDGTILSPGSGGGGAGGFVQISAAGQLHLFPTAQIFARGGEAYQAPDGAGNGGSGAGGAIWIQGQSRVQVDEGAVIDVRGGSPNLDPVAEGLNPTYTPNGDVASAGAGSAGRVRIETPLGFSDGDDLAIDPPFSSGSFATAGLFERVAVTLPFAVASDGVVRNGFPTFQPALIDLAASIPAGAHLITLWEGAEPDAANPGVPGPFFGLTEDTSLLDGADFIRAQIFIYSSANETVEVDRIELPFD